MIQEQNNSQASDTSSILSRGLHRLDSLQQDQDTTLTVVKVNPKICGPQIFLYITTLYLLTISAFYLQASLSKSAPIDCPLTCSINENTCSCELGAVSWTGSTIVELPWHESPVLQGTDLFQSIKLVSLLHGNQSYLLEADTEIEVICLPGGCRALLVLFDLSISQHSILQIAFDQLPFDDKDSPAAVFRQYSANYPQPTTRSQLAINLIFTILMGLFIFLRKSLPGQYELKGAEARKDQKDKQESIPTEIETLDRDLAEKYEKALATCIAMIEEKQQFEILESEQELSMLGLD